MRPYYHDLRHACSSSTTYGVHPFQVYKDECMFSYDSPESPGGLYVNLNTLQVSTVVKRDTGI